MKNTLCKKKILDLGIRTLISVALIVAMALASYYISLNRDRRQFEQLAHFVRSNETDKTESDGKGKNTVLPINIGRSSSKTAKDPNAETAEQVKSMLEGIRSLHEENKDLAGWVTVPGTKVDYPVMFTPKEPEYYLKRGFAGEDSVSGTPFLDYRTSLDPLSDNIIVYGHNMKDGSMFSDLLRYRDREYYEDHPRMEFYTLTERQTYEIFAVIQTEVYDNRKFDCYSLVDAKSREAFDEFFKQIKHLSLYDTGVTVEYGDRVLTLSTCSYQAENGRTLVFGRYRP